MRDEKEYKEFVRDVGERVSKLRIKRNYTRECLAALANISPKFLYEIETGKKCCSSYVLYMLASSLNVSVNEFFGGKSDNQEAGDDSYYLKFDQNQKLEVDSLLQVIYKMVNKD